MSEKSILTVLVPTYRRADFLQHCLQSLIDARVNMVEVIIGDDGGDEATLQVCKKFLEFLPIKYLPPKPFPQKGSLSSNLSRLTQAATSEWVLLLHDDDFLVGDHSQFPNKFADNYDFYFTDHFNANENGQINNENSLFASKKYGRELLQEGLQNDVFDLGINARVCLDGFYIKTKFVQKTVPDENLGPVSDFFWVFNLLNSGLRVGYSSERTFAYRTTEVGLTASGIDFDSLIKGFNQMKLAYPVHAKKIDEKISYYSWYAVNKSLRENEKSKAWSYLNSIHFRYTHSIKSQFLMIIQLLIFALPASIAKKIY